MKLAYHRDFKKQYKKLPPAQKKRLAKALNLFIVNPRHSDLYNHPLSGKWKEHHSISFGGNWRAIYRVVEDRSALFVAVGTHSQLYK